MNVFSLARANVANLVENISFWLLFAILTKLNENGVFFPVLLNVAQIDKNSVFACMGKCCQTCRNQSVLVPFGKCFPYKGKKCFSWFGKCGLNCRKRFV